ncbi:LLM class flavin-dependent oxidoreductase [Paraconexibacter antarcticus]|uniref:LLM class flavin-dependent oxidoreductase n=2 Tax=Paraconexibacter antarcticus TaxID=2949664 RepID=A0ABY5DXF3_9ACTN|nr:LLM class flavin-dependent oxidoreductase [Paraconexibacter antarcticus]
MAEEAGFAGAWMTEFYDRSATVSLAAMATAASTITLGSAIAYAFGRTPLDRRRLRRRREGRSR